MYKGLCICVCNRCSSARSRHLQSQRCLALAVATFKDVSVGDEGIRKAHEAK